MKVGGIIKQGFVELRKALVSEYNRFLSSLSVEEPIEFLYKIILVTVTDAIKFIFKFIFKK